MRPHSLTLIASLSLVALVGCGNEASQTVEAGMGPNPVLPAPESSLLPTVNVATAKPWAKGETPKAAAGLQVAAFAEGLDHPRWLYVLPNGDVLVAETNTPPQPGETGLKAWVGRFIMRNAGAGAPTANRITLLRDADHDGVAEIKKPFIENLYSPFGMALVGNTFYVANADAIVSFPYVTGETHIDAAPTKVMDLPGGPINHHWTKNILASKDGKHLFVTVGSNSNVGDNGMEAEKGRAAIHELDLATGQSRLFATGLRNPNGMALEPVTGALWTAVNERDEIGSDLVPDYMTSVKDGAFYGWPYSYYGQNVDVRVKPQNPELVATAIKPDYALGPHTASLGLTFDTGDFLPSKYAGGAFIGQHGSWNRKPASGYKVIFVPFTDGKPSGASEDVLTGFLDKDGNAQGRPVGVILDKAGALLVADDVGNTIWRVTPAK
ncbi:MAG: PQQ-dependent sugar dehydrogenase [Parvibaculaceae bacterium]